MLRPYAWFWGALSIGCLTAAIAGPPFTVALHRLDPDSFVTVQFFIAQFLGAPLLAIGYATIAAIAPNWRSRLMLLGAGFVEGAVGTYTFFCLLVLQHSPI
jgi:hypothetical protein